MRNFKLYFQKFGTFLIIQFRHLLFSWTLCLWSFFRSTLRAFLKPLTVEQPSMGWKLKWWRNWSHLVPSTIPDRNFLPPFLCEFDEKKENLVQTKWKPFFLLLQFLLHRFNKAFKKFVFSLFYVLPRTF